MRLIYIYLTLFVVAMLIFLIFIMRKQIMAFLRPDDWVVIEMIELDDNVKTWLQKKTSDLRFKFNDGIYNMFHPKGSYKGVPQYFKNTVYRKGRIGKFFYIEGREDPLDFRNQEVSTNPQMLNEMLKVDLSRLLTGDDGFGMEFLRKYGIFVLIGFGLLLIFALFREPKVEVVENTAPIFLYLWRKRK